MTVDATLAARVVFNLLGAVNGNLQPSSYLDTTYTQELASGTGAEQADKVVSLTGTLTAGGTIGLDLSGALTDVFGASVSIAKLKGVLLVNTSTIAAGTGGNVKIDPATTTVLNFTSNGFNLGPQGILFVQDPQAAGLCTITNSSADLLVLKNNHSSYTSTYAIHIVGSSV